MATAPTALVAIALPFLSPASSPVLNADNYCIQIPVPILSIIAICEPSIGWFNDAEYVMCMMRKREFTKGK